MNSDTHEDTPRATCPGTTRSGPCKLRPGRSGYCFKHTPGRPYRPDPARARAARAAVREELHRLRRQVSALRAELIAVKRRLRRVQVSECPSK